MIVAESRRGRRIVGRLDRGADLFDTLREVCQEHSVRSGELRAIGSLEMAEIAEYDQNAREYKPSRKVGASGLEILSLCGNVSERAGELALHAHVTLMRDRDSGIEVLGGHLLAARVFALEFVIEAYDDLILRRGEDQTTGLPSWQEAIERPSAPLEARTQPAEVGQSDRKPPEPEPQRPSPRQPNLSPAAAPTLPAPSTSSSPPPSWADVAAASAGQVVPPQATGVVATARKLADSSPGAVEDEDQDEDERDEQSDDEESDDTLEPGDFIVHPTFGRCEVQRIEGAYEFAQVRLRNGRLVRLSLDVLRLTASGRENDRRVFRASVHG